MTLMPRMLLLQKLYPYDAASIHNCWCFLFSYYWLFWAKIQCLVSVLSWPSHSQGQTLHQAECSYLHPFQCRCINAFHCPFSLSWKERKYSRKTILFSPHCSTALVLIYVFFHCLHNMERLVAINHFLKETSVAGEYAYIIKGGTAPYCHSLMSFSGAVIPLTLYFIWVLYHGRK